MRTCPIKYFGNFLPISHLLEVHLFHRSTGDDHAVVFLVTHLLEVGIERLHSIFRGFDDCFYVPHSRHTEVRREDILKVPELTLLSESKDAGVYMAMARGGREFFVTGHSEYSPYTLDTEYRRDLGKGLPIEIPRNYYVDDDPDKGPLVRWRAHANLLFSNWLNYFVYQETPYNINDIE